MCSIRVVSRSSDVRGLLKLGMLDSELMRVAMNFYTALLRRLLFGRWSPVLMLAVSALSGSLALVTAVIVFILLISLPLVSLYSSYRFEFSIQSFLREVASITSTFFEYLSTTHICGLSMVIKHSKH